LIDMVPGVKMMQALSRGDNAAYISDLTTGGVTLALGAAGGRLAAGGEVETVGASTAADDFTTLYHGTTAENASIIRTNGIDLSKGNPSADFGRGFYMTSSREEALQSAGRLYSGPLDAVEFNVPNSQLSGLSKLDFGSADSAWQDFVKFNKTYGPDELLHGGQPYDLVTGPLYRRFNSAGVPIPWENRLPQTSIHTPTAVDLFNANVKR